MMSGNELLSTPSKTLFYGIVRVFGPIMDDEAIFVARIDPSGFNQRRNKPARSPVPVASALDPFVGILANVTFWAILSGEVPKEFKITDGSRQTDIKKLAQSRDLRV